MSKIIFLSVKNHGELPPSCPNELPPRGLEIPSVSNTLDTIVLCEIFIFVSLNINAVLPKDEFVGSL